MVALSYRVTAVLLVELVGGVWMRVGVACQVMI